MLDPLTIWQPFTCAVSGSPQVTLAPYLKLCRNVIICKIWGWRPLFSSLAIFLETWLCVFMQKLRFCLPLQILYFVPSLQALSLVNVLFVCDYRQYSIILLRSYFAVLKSSMPMWLVNIVTVLSGLHRHCAWYLVHIVIVIARISCIFRVMN